MLTLYTKHKADLCNSVHATKGQSRNSDEHMNGQNHQFSYGRPCFLLKQHFGSQSLSDKSTINVVAAYQLSTSLSQPTQSARAVEYVGHPINYRTGTWKL